MAVVPITAAKGPTAEPQNDTDMAIAAALLHREGRFDNYNQMEDRAVKHDLQQYVPKGKDTVIEVPDDGDRHIHGEEGEGMMIPGGRVPDTVKGNRDVRGI